MRAAVLALAGAVVLGGCASDKLTLFENEDGNETGAVAVIDEKTGADKALVDTARTEAKLSSRPKPRAVKELKPAYTQLLGNLPPKARGFTFTFAMGKDRIPDDQRGILELLRKELSIRPGAQIEVLGFTDTVDDDKRNDELSKDRALAVVAELREMGFAVDPEDAVGRGEREARDNGEPDGYPNELYRKVVVIVR